MVHMMHGLDLNMNGTSLTQRLVIYNVLNWDALGNHSVHFYVPWPPNGDTIKWESQLLNQPHLKKLRRIRNIQFQSQCRNMQD